MTEDFRSLPDVASRALGAGVLWCNDDFYADVHSLIAAQMPRHDPDEFNARGKVYDGWETRRRREPGSDAVIIRLAAPAVVRGVTIDTSYFKGNFPPLASVEGVSMFHYPSVAELLAADWVSLVDKTDLEGDSANVVATSGPDRLVTHVRLSIYPDGGVARFRVFGDIVADPHYLGGRIDLGATLNGGRIIGCSNMFYSAPANVLAPGRSQVMSDGWETARRRDDGNDWLSVALAAPGSLHDVIIDTTRFVGNAPGWASLTDLDSGEALLPRTPLTADTEHRFRIASSATVASVRLDIYPDGGISRLRLNGEVAESARAGIIQRWLGLLPDDLAAGSDSAHFFD
jgi:allantoicase